jgi:hypothetical protein
VLVIVALIEDVQVNFSQKQRRLMTTMRTVPAPCYTTLSPTKSRLGLTVQTRILESGAVREHGKGQQAYVDTYGCIGSRQRLWRSLDREADVPALALTLDRYGFDLPVNRAVQLDLDDANALQRQPVTRQQQLISISVTKRDAVVSEMRLKARKSRFLATFDPLEKCPERLVQTPQYILSAMAIRQTEISCRSNFRQL